MCVFASRCACWVAASSISSVHLLFLLCHHFTRPTKRDQTCFVLQIKKNKIMNYWDFFEFPYISPQSLGQDRRKNSKHLLLESSLFGCSIHHSHDIVLFVFLLDDNKDPGGETIAPGSRIQQDRNIYTPIGGSKPKFHKIARCKADDANKCLDVCLACAGTLRCLSWSVT